MTYSEILQVYDYNKSICLSESIIYTPDRTTYFLKNTSTPVKYQHNNTVFLILLGIWLYCHIFQKSAFSDI